MMQGKKYLQRPTAPTVTVGVLIYQIYIQFSINIYIPRILYTSTFFGSDKPIGCKFVRSLAGGQPGPAFSSERLRFD